MSKKTAKLNVQVNLGKKTYQPGQPVPIGGKDGMSEDELQKLIDAFGPYQGTSEIGTSADRDLQLAERNSRIGALEAEVQAALVERDKARDELTGLQKRVDEAEADNAVLAKRVKELEAAGK